VKVNELFPKKYACGADLQGKAVTMTIARIEIIMMRPHPQAKQERKGVVYFEGAQKSVILSSRAMADQIAEIAGTDEMNAWPGTRITLYPEPMTVAGKARIAIRARAPLPENGTTAPPATLQDDEEEITADPETGEIIEPAIE